MRWDLRAVELDFFQTASQRFTYNAVIRRDPARVFAAIAEDPAGWGNWYPGFDHSGRWLSPGPPDVGSRRRVRMAFITYDETILAWEPPHRFAFRVDRAAAPFAHALAEDYQVGPHPAGAVLTWTFAIEPRRLLRPALWFFDPALALLFRRAGANLERNLEP